MKVRQYIGIILVTFLLSVSVTALAEDKVNQKHWAYEQLADFKQSILPLKQNISVTGPITREEWEVVYSTVLSEDNLDNPIHTAHWAILLKMILDPDKGKRAGQMLDMYVYRLSDSSVLLREDAVGGLVKLLTARYISGSWSAEQLEPSRALKDIEDISDRQSTLVQAAFCEGILDSNTSDYFRPKDRLTNAEAVSMLYRVIQKYNIPFSQSIKFPESHWSSSSINNYMLNVKPSGENLVVLSSMIDTSVKSNILDSPVDIQKWNDLLFNTLKLKDSKYEADFLRGYTYGLSNGKHITRDKAAAGLVKLLHAAELVKGRDATNEELQLTALRFVDFEKVFDKSKLAIANSEGLIYGYENKFFHPERMLTNGEAIALIDRVVEKYLIEHSAY